MRMKICNNTYNIQYPHIFIITSNLYFRKVNKVNNVY